MSNAAVRRYAPEWSRHRPTGPLGLVERARDALRHKMDATVDRWLGDDARKRFDSLAWHETAGGVDPFGFDPRVAKYAVVAARAVYRDWFRAEVHGIENVPDGRVLLISNHSGQIPLDAMSIACALLLDRESPRFVRSMVEKWTATLPFVSVLFPRLGQIVGVPENCSRLLEEEEAATPEAVIGAEEQYISIADLNRVARLLGMPAFPVIPQLLLPGGFLPLPTKYRIYFGEPLSFTGDPDDEDAAIEEKVLVVKRTIQNMLNRGLKERRSIFR